MIETRLLQYFLAVAEEQSISGDVYIGCGEHRSTFSIMQIIRSIQEEYPDILFHFFSSNADAIIERLDKGLLDMGFLLEPEITPRYDYRKLPLREAWASLCERIPLLQTRKKSLSRIWLTSR